MTIDECYSLLALEIIAQAARDYIYYLEANDRYMIHALRRFFKSQYFDLLSGGEVDSEWIIAELEKRRCVKLKQRHTY